MPYCYVCGKAILNDEDSYCSDECYAADSDCDDGFYYGEQRLRDDSYMITVTRGGESTSFKMTELMLRCAKDKREILGISLEKAIYIVDDYLHKKMLQRIGR